MTEILRPSIYGAQHPIYILQPEVMGVLKDQGKGAGGEIQLTDAMAKMIGNQPFHAIDLDVGPGVLVPRPDTETLVDALLEWVEEGEEILL